MLRSPSCRRSLRSSSPRFLQPLTIREEDGCQILECRVDGYPKPDIRWEKSGKPVAKSRRIHMIRSGDTCLLQIKMPQIEDSGLYSCTATNIMGTTITQTKFSIKHLKEEKMNGSSKEKLGPVKSKELRSRSSERRNVSLSVDSTLSNAQSRTRSRSASRDSRQNSQNATPKSKFSHFSQIWKKNEDKTTDRSVREQAVVHPSKKQLSKSMEDCRKNRKSFLRVKIPDIFVGEMPEVTKDNQRLSDANKRNGELKTNGIIRHNQVPYRTLSTAEDNIELVDYSEKGSQLKQKKPGRISSYLKRFENATAVSKSKDSSKASGGSLKQSGVDVKNAVSAAERRHSGNEESEGGFFKFGRFMRRKSSSSNSRKSSVDVNENDENDSALIVNGGEKFEIINIDCEENDSKLVFDGNDKKNYSSSSTNDEYHCDQVKDQTLDSQFSHENFQQNNVLNSSIIDVVCSELKESDCTLVPEIISHAIKEEPTNSQSTQSDRLSDVHTSAEPLISDVDLSSISIIDSKDVTSCSHVPTISVDQATKSCEDIDADPPLKSAVEECAAAIFLKSPNTTKAGSISLPKHCKGKIRYSGDLIEEECESFLEAKSPPPESLDLDPQRVSSPTECPARIVKGPQSVTVLRGESVTLAISFSGHPQPKVTWMKGGRVLREEGRLSTLEGREMSVVTVNDVTADDSGKYVVSVENEGGGDSCFASVAVVGFPEPPGGEPTASEVTDHSLVLSWYGSMYDGGSVVTGYQVEMCCLPDRRWHKVASSVNTSCSIQGLSKGQRYMFRVRAENRYGASHPSKDSKVIILDDFLQYDTSSEEEPEEPSMAVTVETGSEFTERFDLKEEVGKGRFGTVYRCVEKCSGRPRAAKVIRCLKMKDKEKVRQEIEIMSRLHHPKLMQVLAAFESGRNMIMVMEFISGGELFERVIADDFVLTEQDCILFMRQICNGVAYMHRHNILHLDLKPENILCKTRTSHKIKIIDFGLARVYNSDENLRILFGTPEFVAPEVINYEPVCPASDMWSVGVICYVLLSGLSPFMGDSDTETFSNITRGEMDFDDEAFDEISQDAKDFISNLLVKKLKGRMSAEECLNHPWLAKSSLLQKRPLSTEKLKRFIIRRKWQKSGTAIRALGRMVSLSRSSLGSSVDSYSPLGSPTSSRSRSSLMSRSETAESGDSDVFQEAPR
ncbi:myosin light chain kinase, smooth muscle-like isoform X2 [Uloborus diversus]|uniref:myosin light chain kinase, smooth muscle-like isoform X2 n=1 Tax=Uloborus diversus TaxID=327109 RepID=UPI0024091B74|nr:myosin light chain kinase, smooth muscle-like isoform X2 [Uloborus diversus]